MEYREEIIDHYKNPRNFGEMEDADVTINEANASCGDVIQIQVKTQKIKNSKNQNGEKYINEIRWRGVGCAISTAAASMLSEKVVGMKVKDISKIGEEGIKRMMGGEINLGRMKCATLAYRGLLRIFEEKNQKI